MITNTALVIRPIVGLVFLVAGMLLLRRSASQGGAWLITLGAVLFIGADLYGIFTLRPFVGRDYDEHWFGQIATVEALDTAGLALCACGLLAHAWRATVRTVSSTTEKQ